MDIFDSCKTIFINIVSYIMNYLLSLIEQITNFIYMYIYLFLKKKIIKIKIECKKIKIKALRLK